MKKLLLSLIPLVLITLLLAVPAALGFAATGAASPYWRGILGGFAAAALIVGLLQFVRNRSQPSARRTVSVWWGALPIIVVGILAFLVRVTFAGVAAFSGSGFTAEFFFHALEPGAYPIVWAEYGWLILLSAMIIALTVWFLHHLIKRLPQLNGLMLAGLVLAGLVIAGAGRSALLPEWRLATAWQDWRGHSADGPMLNADLFWAAADAGLVSPVLVHKAGLQTKVPVRPRNLIIVYLESFNDWIVGDADFPGLTPELQRLADTGLRVEDNVSTAYVTIEGLVNSLCGLMTPMLGDSETFASRTRLMENLPCLSDILGHAGYHQVYLGGASLDFAGKGAFLKAHGYDEVWGSGEWRTAGRRFDGNPWGYPDNRLFERALERVAALDEQEAPYHLTLLTLGTHLPGYQYRGCENYPQADGRRFLDAIHCTDQLLGEFVSQLRDGGYLEDTLLVITSDHGVFPNPVMRDLFGDKVQDRRLFTLLLGAVDSAGELTPGMASYDLAPTVLDLLQVGHNADFLHGRSAARSLPRDRYVLTRYQDYLGGEAISTPVTDCDESAPFEEFAIPLSRCEKSNYIGTLYAYLRRFDAITAANFDCGQESLLRMTGEAASPAMILGGVDVSERFNRTGWDRRLAPGGIYLVHHDPEWQEMRLRAFRFSDKGYGRLNSALKNQGPYLLISWPETGVQELPDGFAVFPAAIQQALEGAMVQGAPLLIANRSGQPGEADMLPVDEIIGLTDDFCGALLYGASSRR